MKVVLNLGMGVDSSVIAHRWLTDPSSRDFDLADLVVVTAMPGDEFTDTKRVVEAHLFPLFRDKGVRYVQLARSGPRQADGFTVLSDTRAPDTLHIEGVYRLSQELLTAGAGPQVASRRCSLKFKGQVIDAWLAQEMGGAPFRQVMGFNADEQGRVDRDQCYGGDARHAEYPLLDWGMGRAACEAYLLRHTGEAWPKSCCTMCPFANGKPEVLARFRAMPEQAAQALLLEHVCTALNPRMTLYRDRSLLSCLIADGNDAALGTFTSLLEGQRWALYRVRRVYHARGRADRSVTKEAEGTQQEMAGALLGRVGRFARWEGGHFRCWLARREPGAYPTAEEMLVVAPALVADKARPAFERNWGLYSLEVA